MGEPLADRGILLQWEGFRLRPRAIFRSASGPGDRKSDFPGRNLHAQAGMCASCVFL